MADLALRRSEAAASAASHLPPLLVAAEKLAASILLGVHGRRRAGTGESFWQYRPYSFGDAINRIDWRRSARADRVFIRENEWEGANTLWLYASTGPRMDYHSNPALNLKRDRGLLLALALASLALRAQERVGAIGSGKPASSARTSLTDLALWMAEPHPGHLPPETRLQRNAAVLIISDFLDPPDEIAASLAPIANQGVRGHLVQIIDPSEESLPWDGRVEFRALDTPLQYLAQHTQSLRQAYQEKFAAQRQAVAGIAARFGWSFTSHHTDRAPAPALLGLYQQISGQILKAGGGGQ
jgi:uncharacterized protein (DUF58 family)